MAHCHAWRYILISCLYDLRSGRASRVPVVVALMY